MTTETLVNSSPTKSLSSWWKNFKNDEVDVTRTSPRPSLGRNSASEIVIPQKESNEPMIGQDGTSHLIFGAPLKLSLKYAGVRISLTDTDGDTFEYGTVPVVIAKCAVFLKKNALNVEGIFRIPGSVRRIRVLQDLFSTPPGYGRNVDWEGFTAHDAANLLKRYLSSLPDPVVPKSRYQAFRDPLNKFVEIKDYYKIVNSNNGIASGITPCDPQLVSSTLAEYEKLIFQLPRSSRQLLLYLIDMISIFASHSEQNRMTMYNLAAIFQPSVLTIPEHDMQPEESQVSRAVLQFLCDNSEKLLQDVQIRAIAQHEKQKLGECDYADDGASDSEFEENEPATPIVTNVPTLIVPQVADTKGFKQHRRQHSKSVSSAQSPTLNLEQDSHKFPFLRRQRSRTSRSNSNSEEQNDDDERKSRFRRSLMVLLPGSGQTTPQTEERPDMKRSPSWFARLTEKRVEE